MTSVAWCKALYMKMPGADPSQKTGTLAGDPHTLELGQVRVSLFLQKRALSFCSANLNASQRRTLHVHLGVLAFQHCYSCLLPA